MVEKINEKLNGIVSQMIKNLDKSRENIIEVVEDYCQLNKLNVIVLLLLFHACLHPKLLNKH